ncbi:IS1595 family transposase [Entomospira culicis]|uniref:IS1595 family transposase n=1 Tax=Entomospira culicis TaxID=2719989 RepID=A0A968GIS3_9SPIO|nr:IS1595 family transposase [Entomospira culicis]NIZ19268.1 IS1595 family transposase [Entomospira culicis]NIZ69827.1 IS1595 family transposase [Entomospira culicis]WDI36934.1 IS1595 family transposase [Entomospira culicis]WDI38563.1 IS1595 family transposase [Entomospira culicis]
MTIVEIIRKYQTQEQCIQFLEKARWAEGVICPYCNSTKTGAKKESNRSPRHQCYSCQKSFSVTSGTIFDNAKLLPQWFQILALMLNAKKSLSSYQISRDLGLRQGTALKIQNKIRVAMNTKESILLQGIIEMDETYIGGKPRGNVGKNKRGRGTNKTAVVGVQERGGEVRVEVVDREKESMNFKTLKRIFDDNVDKIKSILVTDEYLGYAPMGNNGVSHFVINHSERFVAGDVHTNSIEGFWSLIKRAWYGSHHHYSKKNTHLYVGETSYVYNNRKNKNLFIDTIEKMLEKF